MLHSPQRLVDLGLLSTGLEGGDAAQLSPAAWGYGEIDDMIDTDPSDDWIVYIHIYIYIYIYIYVFFGDSEGLDFLEMKLNVWRIYGCFMLFLSMLRIVEDGWNDYRKL